MRYSFIFLTLIQSTSVFQVGKGLLAELRMIQSTVGTQLSQNPISLEPDSGPLNAAKLGFQRILMVGFKDGFS